MDWLRLGVKGLTEHQNYSHGKSVQSGNNCACYRTVGVILLLKEIQDFALAKVLRWGGNDFLVFCQDLSHEKAQAVDKTNYIGHQTEIVGHCG